MLQGHVPLSPVLLGRDRDRDRSEGAQGRARGRQSLEALGSAGGAEEPACSQGSGVGSHSLWDQVCLGTLKLQGKEISCSLSSHHQNGAGHL